MYDAMDKNIFGYWHQGRDAAPEDIKACWDLWARMNPDWDLRILEWDDIRPLLEEHGVDGTKMSFTGISNIVRLAGLTEHGGVWVDAYTVPLHPLADFLPPLMTSGFFAYHDPYRKRRAETWFLGAVKGNALVKGWRDKMLKYWRIPRRPMRFKRELDNTPKGAILRGIGRMQDKLQGPISIRGRKRIYQPKDPSWAVDVARGGGGVVTPYFTCAMLFDLMIEQSPALRAEWAQMPKRTSYDVLYLRHWKKQYGEMTETDLQSLIAHTPMQKLSLPTPLPDWAMRTMVEMAEANMPS